MNNAFSPKVSVMLCTNTVDKYLDLALKSIENQNLYEIEIIIVANNLSDVSYQKLQDRALDPRIFITRTSINGVAFSRNLALHLCRAPYVAVMDADDIAYPERLRIQLEYMEENLDVAVCGSTYDLIDENGNVLDRLILPSIDAQIRRKMIWTNPICHPSVMFKLSAIRSIGGYGNNGAEDYDLWVRLASSLDIKFSNLTVSLIGYRVPVISRLRRSKSVYSHVAAIQFQQSMKTKNLFWLIASVITVVKMIFRGRNP